MKKPKRDRHVLGGRVAESIKESYQSRPLVPGKVVKTVLKKEMRKRKKP